MARRPLYNSNDFQAEPAKPVKAGTAAPMTDGANEATQEGEPKPVEKRKKKKKSLSAGTTKEQEIAATLESRKATPLVAETKEQRRERRRREKEAAAKASRTPDTIEKSKEKRKSDKQDIPAQETPTSAPRKKKRKRESEILPETPKVPRASIARGSFVVGADLVENVKASLSGRDIPGTLSFRLPRMPVEVLKRKKKADPKGDDVRVEEQRKPKGPVKAHETPVPEKPEVKRYKKSATGTPQQKPSEPVKDRETLEPEKPAVKKQKKSAIETPQQQQSEAPSSVKTPRQTPIPPPQLSHVLVPETPPSKAVRKGKPFTSGPVPFSLSQPVGNTATQRYLPRKENVTAPLSTPTNTEDAAIPRSAPAAMTKVVPRPTVPNALTDANLNNHTQPSSQETKVKKRSRSGVSTATSLLESSSNRSIIDAFARVGKPYVRSGAEVDPFTSAETRAKQRLETHEEASMKDFNSKFLGLQKAVNFSEERSYLQDYLAWNAAAASDTLPCLGNVTGCTTKKEEILRLSKEEDMTILGHLDTEAGDLNALKDASARMCLADKLLHLSLRARVPVPIGRLEGTWALYSPKYAQTHFDRYGYGQRTLTISSIAGFRHENSYTARLNIPPRSMAYSILAFSTPPHASFRTTAVKTAAEGYTVDIVFLGNGYLQLRADLKLLLKGKASEECEGKKVCMEFIGVHERAVKWVEEKDELEEAVRKLFAKYDGGSEE